MSLKDDLEAAKANPVAPVRVPVTVNGTLYEVECSRLESTVWDGIVARSPARAEQHFRVGYDTGKASVIAMTEHGRIYGPDGEAETDVDWEGFIARISGVELRAISAAWWGLNEDDPNSAVIALKKASEGGA